MRSVKQTEAFFGSTVNKPDGNENSEVWLMAADIGADAR
jgi:hypothetical protein